VDTSVLPELFAARQVAVGSGDSHDRGEIPLRQESSQGGSPSQWRTIRAKRFYQSLWALHDRRRHQFLLSEICGSASVVWRRF
jgi:hypothetical protein